MKRWVGDKRGFGALTRSKKRAQGIVETMAMIQMQRIMKRARRFVICSFKGHQMARNLRGDMRR